MFIFQSYNLYIKYINVGMFARLRVSLKDASCSPADDSDAAPQDSLTPDFFNFKYLPVGKVGWGGGGIRELSVCTVTAC